MNKSKYIFLAFVFCFLVNSELFSQVKPKYKKTIRAEGGLPHEFFSNKAFRQTFSGLFTVNASMNFGIRNFNVGVFAGFTEFQMLYKFLGDPNSIQNNYAGGLRFSYDLYTSTKKGMFSPFIAPGYSFIDYTKLQYTIPPTQTKYNAININVGITYNMMLIDDWTGVGFVVGYTFLNHQYDPYALSQIQQNFPNYTDYKGDLQNFYFGFCVYFDFARPRDAGDD
jgi:hypothetical protein